MKPINIISTNNGTGLAHSARIIEHVLTQAGFAVTINRLWHCSPNFGTFNINIFLERIDPEYLDLAELNFLIPNQEYFEDMEYLHLMDSVLCKTKHAQKIFDGLNCETEYISFTSSDHYLSSCNHDYGKFFHLAGRSLTKGTELLVDLWEKHPEWPTLTVVQHPETRLPIQSKNINYINEYIDEDALRRYQNNYSVHLCPSEAEGFGHYIVEGMSSKALVLTTDAPPMNELVTPERGILIGYQAKEPMWLGTRFFADPSALEKAVETIIGMDDTSKQKLAKNGRNWYEENNQFFIKKVTEVMANA